MSIKLLITGDYCPIGRNSEKLYRQDYSFFGDLSEVIKTSDVAITNLEIPVTKHDKKILKSGPNLKVGLTAISALKDVGINLVTLANNHILDYGEKGLTDTINLCKKMDLDYVGAGMNLKEARKIYSKEINSKKIGIVNFAENEFGSADVNSGGANPVNPISNYNDIKETKKFHDYVVVIAHGGREHYQLPTPKQRERYRFYIDCGADIVVGHHTHCYSGYEIYNGKPIFYSLGNFIFDYKEKYQKGNWTEGYAVLFKIGENKTEFQLIPYYQGRKENPNLVLFSESERETFNKKIDKLNSIIADDILFYNAWDDYIKTQKKYYKGMLLIQNEYLRAATYKGMLPDIIPHSKKHKLLLLNLLRCETHNEIMIEVLENKLLSRK